LDKGFIFSFFYNPAISNVPGFADASIVIPSPLLPERWRQLPRKVLWSMVFGFTIITKEYGPSGIA
jgi:hypothetical protein